MNPMHLSDLLNTIFFAFIVSHNFLTDHNHRSNFWLVSFTLFWFWQAEEFGPDGILVLTGDEADGGIKIEMMVEGVAEK